MLKNGRVIYVPVGEDYGKEIKESQERLAEELTKNGYFYYGSTTLTDHLLYKMKFMIFHRKEEKKIEENQEVLMEVAT